MVQSPEQLRVELRRAGIANAAIDAAWPQWWSSDAETSLSATAELTFTVARRLGLSPRALLDGEAKFVWRDATKFKHLTAEVSEEQAALSAFGRAVGNNLLRGVPSPGSRRFAALEVRESILATSSMVDTDALLVVCWGLGIPVVQLKVFPLSAKRMHAMSVGVDDSAAILLARSERYSAPAAFTIAHEIGHLMLGHVDGGGSLVDMENPLQVTGGNDAEEAAADAFALELLTGQAQPDVVSDSRRFSASQLADAVLTQGPQLQIDPGVLALCAGHATQQWDKAYGALKIIPPGQQDVSAYINELARRSLDWTSVADDAQDYLCAILGIARPNV